MLNAIQRFGVMATLGRPVLWADEIKRMQYVENLLKAYSIREKSGDWATFTNQFPYWANQLFQAASLLDG